MRHLIKKNNFFLAVYTLFFVQFIIVDSEKMTRKGIARAPGTCSVNNAAYYLGQGLSM